jgi:hypothetical protein
VRKDLEEEFGFSGFYKANVQLLNKAIQQTFLIIFSSILRLFNCQYKKVIIFVEPKLLQNDKQNLWERCFWR